MCISLPLFNFNGSVIIRGSVEFEHVIMPRRVKLLSIEIEIEKARGEAVGLKTDIMRWEGFDGIRIIVMIIKIDQPNRHI